MPQQMKFWELTSAFRGWPEMVRQVLALPRWRDPYLRQYEHLNRLIDQQDRGVLDAPIPLELSREVAARCPTRFVFDPASRYVRQRLTESPLPAGLVQMSAVEVHDQFGGSLIEEVFEKGS